MPTSTSKNKEPLVHITPRVPTKTIAYYKKHYPRYTEAMRHTLEDHAANMAKRFGG